MKRRAQMEIIGLVVIVLIVSIAMMFYLSYASSDSSSSKKSIYKSYSHNELAVSFLSALSDTTICGDVNFEDLVSDCGIRNRIICPGTETSCQQLDRILVEIKNETLDKWDFAYGLVINFTTSQETIEYYTYNCTRQTVGRGAPGIFPIAYYPTPGDAIVELGICG